jgi:hypothetical protein
MKSLFAAAALATLIAAPAFVQSAYAQRANMDAARERAMQECIAMNKNDSHDPYGASGGLQHNYRACMMNRGQFD